MHGMRDFGNALMIALTSIVLTVGALSISLVEFAPENLPTATAVFFLSPAPITTTPSMPPTATAIFGLESPTATITPTSTTTSTPPASCQLPYGWVNQITVQAGETLDTLSARYSISKDVLRSGNCLVNDNLLPGTKLYVPPYPANTAVRCIEGASGWTHTYIVRKGDTFYNIAANHFTNVQTIKSVNCRTSDFIIAGETLWVPIVTATRTSNPTALPEAATLTPRPTDPITATFLPYTATVAPIIPTYILPLTSTPNPTVLSP